MSQTYTYSISTDIPGGGFSAAASARLQALIVANIATSAEEISTTGNTLAIRFAAALSTDEKTTLDNNTTGPAGGLVGRSADFVELTAKSVVLQDLDTTELVANGIVSVVITGQLKRGDDVSINGFGESLVIRSTGIAPFNKSSATLDGNGSFTFVVGPSYNRGSINFLLDVQNLSARELIVSFL